jgi:hypothetical protein
VCVGGVGEGDEEAARAVFADHGGFEGVEVGAAQRFDEGVEEVDAELLFVVVAETQAGDARRCSILRTSTKGTLLPAGLTGSIDEFPMRT